MELLGPLGIISISGVLLIIAGNVLTWRAVAKYGGMERSKLLFVVFDEKSPMKTAEAKPDRNRFRLGVMLVAAGMVHLYTGFSVGDKREERVCIKRCRQNGHEFGHFAPSKTLKDKRTGKPLRACWCRTVDQKEIELKQLSLEELSRLPTASASSPAASSSAAPKPAASPASSRALPKASSAKPKASP